MSDKLIDSRSVDAWFESAMQARLLSDDLEQEFHHVHFRFEFALSDPFSAGIPFDVALDSWLVPITFVNRSVWVVFGGFRLDDSDPVGRMATASAPSRIVRFTHIGPETIPNPDYPVATLSTDATGQHTITAEYWLVATVANTDAPSATWNPDGTLAEPPEALYFRRFEISKTIEVLPR